MSQHPHPQQPHKAELELAKALRLAGPDDIRERHAAWRSYWNAHPEKFVPHLWRWLADGDWQTAPVAIERKPPARSQKLQVLEEYLASLKSQKAHA